MNNMDITKESKPYLPTLETGKPRIDYIDLMKGLTILWVIWVHTDYPDVGHLTNQLFFFASGIFFKLSDAKTFFTKRVWMIIIPFCLFYVLSIPFRIIVDLWDYRSFAAFDWNRVLDIFKIEARSDYLSLNVPLWFLITLFMIQAYSFIIFRLSKLIIGILAIVSLITFDWLYSIPTPFMINNAFAWFGYFAIGYLCGKPLIQFLNSTSRKIILLIGTLLTVLACIWIQRLECEDPYLIIEKLKQIAFVICFMTFFSFFNGNRYLEILRFFGKNSLIVLGAHLYILIPLERISFRLTRLHSPWIGLVLTIITAALLIPIINWMNHSIPHLVGKNNIKATSNVGIIHQYRN